MRTRFGVWGQCGRWIAALVVAGPLAAQEYEIGGPLQGVPLPPFHTQHGEPPGWPGVIPELQVADERGRIPFTTEGLPPERHLYDGSVEHFRAYWFKYVPVKSFFDRQSLLTNWLAAALAPGRAEDYAEPVWWVPRHADPRFTGRFNKPVPVVRAQAGDPAFALDCGTLAPGVYALRAIGAVESTKLQRHRTPLVLRLTINDGPAGESSVYRFRCKYVEEFYALAEFYFHAPEHRHYRATLAVDDESRTDVLLHTIDLHNALAGSLDRAIKTRCTLTTPLTNAVPVAANDAARLTADAELWNAFPPDNATVGFIYGGGGDDPKGNQPNAGAGGKTADDIKTQFGEWTTAPIGPVLATNKTLNLAYTMADLKALNPLPDPYPVKDRGTGVFTPAADTNTAPQNLWPIADRVRDRIRSYVETATQKAERFRQKPDPVTGREAAIMLCRIAWAAPTLDYCNALSSVMLSPAAYGRDLGNRRRDPSWSPLGVGFLSTYDRLFPILESDEALAESVGRFVPWVKTPRDVIRLLDVYLVQTLAKRVLRYQHLSDNEPARIVTPVICLGDNTVTQPWMDWLFTSTYVYPYPPSGIQDLLVTASDRDGVGRIASYSYGLGEQCAPKAATLETYRETGGNPRFDLRDPRRFPKPIAACYWYLNSRMAGLYFPRIGDVTGPDKYYGSWMNTMAPQMRLGWRWTRDPKFAYVLKQYGTRENETDKEWAAIERAAASVKRAPWLDAPSRVLINWFGLLETGREHDDPRFRRNVYLRIGQGHGHAHADTLDLQGHAHGYPFTIDGGQRNGYSRPSDVKTRVHNLVEVDGKDWMGHSWIRTLTDAEGARYLEAEATGDRGHTNVSLHRRQVALLDVDAGGLTLYHRPEGTLGSIPKEVVSPNSYIFDVVRVAGGQVHTYCFHGPVEDELLTNVKNPVGLDTMTEADKAYLGKFGLDERKSAGNASDVVEATWRMHRDPKMYGSEQGMYPDGWDALSPRKYTRLHLLGQAGARVMTGALDCFQWKYAFTSLFVQHRAEAERDVVFPALIEPFVGQPFIVTRTLLPISGNETDALRAVAVEVKTVNGRTDLCFADGRPEQTRDVGTPAARVRIAGEFAFVSRDADGLRQATLTGGTRLETPEVALKPAARERAGVVTRADYANKGCVIDQPWAEAPLLKGRVYEIGGPGHWTSYTLADAKPGTADTTFKVDGSADFYLSRVREVDAEKRIVRCVLAMPHTTKENTTPCPGADKHWVASNESRTKFWRADYVGTSGGDEALFEFQLDGPVTKGDFGDTAGFYLWEYGVGDRVRMSTFAALRRLEPALFELSADGGLTVGLQARGLELSVNQDAWKPLQGRMANGLFEAAIPLDDLLEGRGRVYLRAQP